MKRFSPTTNSDRKITNFSLRLGRIMLAIAILLFSLSEASAQHPIPKKIKLPDELHEVSGLYYQSADSLWWHNDSGNPPILYLTDNEGTIRNTVQLAGWINQDWEDITKDASGTIYIGDFGNNCNCRNNLRIYIYHPETQQLDSILFTLEDQELFPPAREDWNFDLEAFFWFKGQLHLFSKNTLRGGNYQTKHYVLSDQPGEHIATIHETLTLKKRVVTGAAISPDGSQVAIIAYHFNLFLGFIPTSKANVFVFSNFEGIDFFSGDRKKHGISPYFIATQYESIDFINENLVYIASERTVFIRPKAKRVRVN